MTHDPWPYVRTAAGDVHRKWVEWGWVQVFIDKRNASAAYKQEWRERKQREALDRQCRERAAQAARKRALGVQSMNLVW